MENLPVYINVGFVLITLLTIWLFYKATNYSKLVWIIITAWLIIQTIISLTGFYTITKTHPPRFLLLVLPALLFIILLFTTNKGRMFIDNMDVKMLTLLHAIRIPVELILFGLFINKTIPEAMTFEGRNFDVLTGLFALPVGYLLARKKSYASKLAIAFNIIGIILLLNILAIAVLSMPTSIRYFMNEPSNKLVGQFPFILLPGVLVPIAYTMHIFSLRQLLVKQGKVDISHVSNRSTSLSQS